MSTTMPIASRRTFVGLGSGVIAAGLSASAIEFHLIDSGHFALEDHCGEIGGLTRGFLARVMPA
jgi:hypothetical protein